MSEMIKRDNLPEDPQTGNAYISVRGYVIDAQRQVYSAVNTAMVTAYWNIGKQSMKFAERMNAQPMVRRF